MTSKKILIVSDAGNKPYWDASADEIREEIGPVTVVPDTQVSTRAASHRSDVILIDISSIADLHELIPRIHQEQPESRIITVSSTPTWKQAREVLRLGAANLIRKSSNLDEVISELRAL